jgi:hypothetical protein
VHNWPPSSSTHKQKPIQPLNEKQKRNTLLTSFSPKRPKNHTREQPRNPLLQRPVGTKPHGMGGPHFVDMDFAYTVAGNVAGGCDGGAPAQSTLLEPRSKHYRSGAAVQLLVYPE